MSEVLSEKKKVWKVFTDTTGRTRKIRVFTRKRNCSQVKRICVICKVRSIHPNDSNYELRRCIACAPNKIPVPGPHSGPNPPGKPLARTLSEATLDGVIAGWRREANWKFRKVRRGKAGKGK
jgi:hypothetical protein